MRCFWRRSLLLPAIPTAPASARSGHGRSRGKPGYPSMRWVASIRAAHCSSRAAPSPVLPPSQRSKLEFEIQESRAQRHLALAVVERAAAARVVGMLVAGGKLQIGTEGIAHGRLIADFSQPRQRSLRACHGVGIFEAELPWPFCE